MIPFQGSDKTMTHMGIIHYFFETYNAVGDSQALRYYISLDLNWIEDINNGYR